VRQARCTAAAARAVPDGTAAQCVVRLGSAVGRTRACHFSSLNSSNSGSGGMLEVLSGGTGAPEANFRDGVLFECEV
jgi:hypothetical protein